MLKWAYASLGVVFYTLILEIAYEVFARDLERRLTHESEPTTPTDRRDDTQNDDTQDHTQDDDTQDHTQDDDTQDHTQDDDM